MLYPLKSPDILLFYLAKISFLYNITRFFISCLLSFTIIFFPVVSVNTVSGVSSTSSIRSGFTNTLTPLIFVTSITLSSPSLLSEHFLHFIRFVHFLIFSYSTFFPLIFYIYKRDRFFPIPLCSHFIFTTIQNPICKIASARLPFLHLHGSE